MSTEQLLNEVFRTCRFQPTQETRAEVFGILADAYNEGLDASHTARWICDELEVSRDEFALSLELLLRPHLEQN